MRHISLSTCGIVDKFTTWQREAPTDAVGFLHAPNDAIRSQTMPVNHRWGVDELFDRMPRICRGNRPAISFEYAMISGVNDTSRLRKEAGDAAAWDALPCQFDPCQRGQREFLSEELPMNKFRSLSGFSGKGITATVRRTLGSDINASCGQLRRRYQRGGGQCCRFT